MKVLVLILSLVICSAAFSGEKGGNSDPRGAMLLEELLVAEHVRPPVLNDNDTGKLCRYMQAHSKDGFHLLCKTNVFECRDIFQHYCYRYQ